MIDWLIEAIIPFSVLASVLVLARVLLLPLVGSQAYYRLYLFLPLSLILPLINIPNWLLTPDSSLQVQKVLVVANEQLQRYSMYDLAFYLWLTGFCLFVGYLLINHLVLIQRAKRWQAIVIDGFKAEGLRIRQSDEVFSPMLIGLIKPMLVIPEEFNQHFSKEQQTLILEHELCHYQRNDLVWNAFALILLAIMWFHPMAWLAFRYYRRDQELSCDETVLARKHTNCRINYSKALVTAAQLTVPIGFAQLSFKEYGDKNVMFERIQFIKNSPKGSVLISLVVIGAFLMSLSAMSFAGSNKAVQGKKAEHIMPIKRIEPKYPKAAVEQKLEGSVVLKFDITPAGDVDNVSVIKATPAGVFDKSAKVALKQWQYQASNAGMKNALVQLDFSLSKSSELAFKQVEQIKVTRD